MPRSAQGPGEQVPVADTPLHEGRAGHDARAMTRDQGIEHGHLVARLHEPLDRDAPDIAGTAGDQHTHRQDPRSRRSQDRLLGATDGVARTIDVGAAVGGASSRGSPAAGGGSPR